MRQDINVSTPDPDSDVNTNIRFNKHIRLRKEHFNLVTKMLGCTSEDDRAALIGMTGRQLYRARNGAVGPKFVASTLAALAEHRDMFAAAGVPITFEAIFEYAVPTAGTETAA